MIKWLKRLVIAAFALYIGLCAFLYFRQESIIFVPAKLPQAFKYNFRLPHEEITVKAKDGVALNSLLFKADSSNGVVFYLHGNAGALDTWGEIADVYTSLNKDLFILDYRGYGKSEGEINSQEQFYSDVQAAYDLIKKRYSEDRITVIGYSIGTGPAAMIAASNNPARLILQAPYYNLSDLMKKRFPFVPVFLLNYKFPVNEYVACAKMPVTVFHGTNDGVIYFGSSLKLKEHFKSSDTLIVLQGATHSNLNRNEVYLSELKKILN